MNRLFLMPVSHCGSSLPGPHSHLSSQNAQAVHLHEYPSERLDALGVIVIVAEEDVELPHRRLPCSVRRNQRVVRRSLVEVRQEPVLQRDRSGPRTRFQPACRRGNQALRACATAWPIVVPRTSSR